MSRPASSIASTLRADANAAGTGLFFGLLQWSAFFLLESYLSSTALVWLLASTVWLLGSLGGLVLPDRPREPWWLALALASFYALGALALRHPYDLRQLPLLLGCVAGMGLYAGRFFRCRRDFPGGARRLFLLENTGFVLGLFLTFALLYWTGLAGLGLAPLPSALLCWASRPSPGSSRRPDGPRVFPA